MDPMLALTLIEAAAKALAAGKQLYDETKATMAESDRAKVAAALESISNDADVMHATIDAELDAAAKS